MLRSMFAGVSGLRAHQTRMDVIGNNIANVNTYGFKKSRAVFKDALYQVMKGASSPLGERGGSNPVGVGLGVMLSSVDMVMTPGSSQSTGRNTDLCIDGNGFFVLEAAGERYYSRAGNFDFDKLGRYVSPGNGLMVMGWMADMSKVDPKDATQWYIDTTKGLQTIDLSGYKVLPPVATSVIRFAGNCDSRVNPLKLVNQGNLDSGDASVVTGHETMTTSKEVYDSLGNKHTVYFRFEKVCAADGMLKYNSGTFQGVNQDLNDAQGKPGTCWRLRASTDPEFPAPTASPSESTDYYLLFDERGTLVDVGAWNGAAPADKDLVWSDATNGIYDNVFSQNHTIALKQELKLVLSAADEPYAGTATPQTVVLNFADEQGNPLVYQHQSLHTAYAEYQDGYTKGDLRSVSIDQTGVINGAFSNGITKKLGRVALATFQNPTGLTAKGGNLFQESPNSGDARIGPPGEEANGVLIPGSLEMSNVDLAEEFTEMIITQRGFQANSRLITTSDEMLQELANLKR